MSENRFSVSGTGLLAMCVAVAFVYTVVLGPPWGTATLFAPAKAHASSAHALPRDQCQEGELCFWQKAGFQGEQRTHEPARTDIDNCTPLGEEERVGAFANLSGLPVTVYESGTCDTTEDFRTYPSGSWVPEPPYGVGAFTMWKR